jgi:hypothetical protein
MIHFELDKQQLSAASGDIQVWLLLKSSLVALN